MSRLPAGPKADRMEVTDIETGHFVFPPVPGEPIRHAELYKALEGAGYEMTDAWLGATGEITSDGRLRTLDAGQPFVLSDGAPLARLLEQIGPGDTVSVYGVWKPGADADTVVVERWGQGSDLPEPEGGP